MSLRTIVQTLGGDLYDRGQRANIPGPGHSPADRSVSLMLDGDRVIVNSFGSSSWREVLDYLRAEELIGADNTVLAGVGPGRRIGVGAEGPTDAERRAAAQRLWDEARPLPRTLAERYCRSRGIVRALPGADVLRGHREVPVSIYRPGRSRRPALLAAIRDAAGRLTAVELTYLAASGARTLDLRIPRKTVGPPLAGSAVRLDPAAPDLLVGEGVFTTLSASEWFGLPAWALLSTRNLRRWSAPEGARSVLIAADRGKDGEASAEVLRGRLAESGLAATVAVPPPGFGDWNEWSVARRRAPPLI
ncbi:MAG: toprim domain-containing protein [Caulobacteraceae bacterium]|nr:toprim domain-containing protein [Caulobacteraceae bacterium]